MSAVNANSSSRPRAGLRWVDRGCRSTAHARRSDTLSSALTLSTQPRRRGRRRSDPRLCDRVSQPFRTCRGQRDWLGRISMPKLGRVLEVFGLARAPAVTSRRQKALRNFSQLGALNLCAVGPWRRREGLESDAARWSLESREVFGAMLAQRRLVEREAGE